MVDFLHPPLDFLHRTMDLRQSWRDIRQRQGDNRQWMGDIRQSSTERRQTMASNIPALLSKAMFALEAGSQGAFGELLGASRRTGQRWALGQSTPSQPEFLELARLLYPVNPALAEEAARVAGTNLVAMGLVVVPPPPEPPKPFIPPADKIMDSVVCAAAEAMNVMPGAMRAPLLAAFTRAREIGLTVEMMEEALRGPSDVSKKKPAK
jgi:hypothetical protein